MPHTWCSASAVKCVVNRAEFGQRYVRNLIDFDNSVVGHLEIFDEIERQLSAGENVVMLANHQTEADPAVRMPVCALPDRTAQMIHSFDSMHMSDSAAEPPAL